MLLNSKDEYTAKRANIRKYCLDNSREKFIYDSNRVLNNYLKCLKNENFSIKIDDPSLMAFLFSIIIFLKEKDNFDNYNNKIFENDIFHLKDCLNQKSENFNILEVSVSGFEKIPNSGIELSGEQFEEIKKHISNKALYYDNLELKNWNGHINIESQNNKIIECFTDKFILKRTGMALIKCSYLYGTKNLYIKFNIGNNKEKNLYRFYFEQLRNVFGHGRFSYNKQGFYTSKNCFDEYIDYNGSFAEKAEYFNSRMVTKIVLNDENRLNIMYNGNNWLNISSFIKNVINLSLCDEKILSENLGRNYSDYGFGSNIDFSYIFTPDFKNKFLKYIILFFPFDYVKRDINVFDDVMNNKSIDLYALILLSKFYINYIYNYDIFEKLNFNYDKLELNEKDNLSYIYMIRNSIAHGRYKYDERGFEFYNINKNGEINFFRLISFDDFEILINKKEQLFYDNMNYDPSNVSIDKDINNPTI